MLGDFQNNLRFGIGPREMAVPAIDTKLIEVMLSLLMPEEALDRSASGVIGVGFERAWAGRSAIQC